MRINSHVGVNDKLKVLVSRLNRLSTIDNVKVKGQALILIRDAKTEKILRQLSIGNVITDGGLEVFATRAVNPYSSRYWCLALGTGSGTPASSDTGLFNEISATRKSGSVSNPASDQARYYVRYLPEEANGYTYTELGVFENTNADLSGGTLINHLMLSPTLEKTSDILVDFYVTFTFS